MLTITLTVRHRPVTGLASLPSYLVADEDLLIGVEVNRPLPDRVSWSTVQVTIDGGSPLALPAESWDVPSDTAKPVTGLVRLSPSLTPGPHTVTTQVLDSTGNPIGIPATGTVRMLGFEEKAAAGPLVVGQPSSVLLTGTAPTGITYRECSASLIDAVSAVSEPALCTPGSSSYAKTVRWTPQAAGSGEVDQWVSSEQGVDSRQTTPVTIYAQRSVALTAPASTSYGGKVKATVTVRDLRRRNGAPAAAQGVTVSLQHRAAGTTTWSTLGTGHTDPSGQVVIGFVSDVTGRLRAIVPSTVPGATVLSAPHGMTSTSTVVWRSLPKSAHRGAVIRASVRAQPFEKGITVRVQARRGTGQWTTVRSTGSTPSGVLTTNFRLSKRGTWLIRAVRIGTALHAAGQTTVKRLSVR